MSNKDFTNFEVNAERIVIIKDKFAAGEASAQDAFGDLIGYILDELNAHKDGDKPAPRGLLNAIKLRMGIAGLGETGTLSKSYIGPSFTLASKLHTGKVSVVMRAIVEDFFQQLGSDFEGAVTRGPLFTPSRLNACWGALMKEDSPFHVDIEGERIVAIDDNGKVHPWHTMTIKELKAFRDGSPAPKIEGSLNRVLGNAKDYDKHPGELMKVVSKLRTENETFDSDIVEQMCLQIEEFVTDQREGMALTLNDLESERIAKERIRLEQKRLERQAAKGDAPIANQEVKGGDVVAPAEETVES